MLAISLLADAKIVQETLIISPRGQKGHARKYFLGCFAGSHSGIHEDLCGMLDSVADESFALREAFALSVISEVHRLDHRKPYLA